jgi:high-affinity Fe2+/Pb2+ permease
MPLPLAPPLFPKHIWVLFSAYFVASLLHFVHNAEFIAIYPNMPTWLTRFTIWFEVVAGLVLALASALLLRRRIARVPA